MSDENDSATVLLTLASLSEQREVLQAAGQLNEIGLTALLDVATRRRTSDVRTSRQLAEIVRDIGSEVGVQSVMPRATYLIAETEAMRGHHENALDLINTAYNQYIFQGEQVQAWRTVVGRLNILGKIGRYDEAFVLGQETISALVDTEETDAIHCLILINQGICFHETGQYQQALETYDAAELIATTITPLQQDYLAINREIVLTILGRYSEAIASAETMVERWSADEDVLPRLKRLTNLGFLYLQTGQYVKSSQTLAEARQLAKRVPDVLQVGTVWLNSADLWLTLNLYPEALEAYQRAQTMLEPANRVNYLARTWRGIGAVLIAMRRNDEAETALVKAADLFSSVKNQIQKSDVLIELAGLYLQQNRLNDALEIGLEAAALVEQKDVITVRFFAHLRLVDLYLARGNWEMANVHLATAANAITDIQLPHLLWIWHHREGQLAWRVGDVTAAEQAWKTAINAIEQLRGTLTQEALRTTFLHDKIDVYSDLITLYLEQGRLQEAFATAEQAKARTLVDLMVNRVDERLAAELPHEEATQLQALQSDLNALYNQLLTNEGSDRGTHKTIQQRVRQLEQSVRHFQLETTPVYLLHSALPFATLQKQLPTHLPIIAYHTLNNEILAFVTHGVSQTVQVVRQLAMKVEIEAELTKLTQRWNRLRRMRHLITPTQLVQHEKTVQRILKRLYDQLFAPIRSLIPTSKQSDPNAQPLVIIPHGILHQLPFHTLFDGKQYLIDLYEISYAPSVTTFALCEQKQSASVKHAALVGVNDASIVHVAAEIAAIADHLPHSTVYTQEQATRSTVAQIDKHIDSLHIASHGMFRADNPMVSAIKLADGWLTANDVMNLPYIPPLVTLSMCESGRTKVTIGDEMLGLTRAFMSRGAATVIATLWLVQDEVAADLMPCFYHYLKTTQTKAAALRQAQLTIRLQYPHPWYWGTFQLLGQR